MCIYNNTSDFHNNIENFICIMYPPICNIINDDLEQINHQPQIQMTCSQRTPANLTYLYFHNDHIKDYSYLQSNLSYTLNKTVICDGLTYVVNSTKLIKLLTSYEDIL